MRLRGLQEAWDSPTHPERWLKWIVPLRASFGCRICIACAAGRLMRLTASGTWLTGSTQKKSAQEGGNTCNCRNFSLATICSLVEPARMSAVPSQAVKQLSNRDLATERGSVCLQS